MLSQLLFSFTFGPSFSLDRIVETSKALESTPDLKPRLDLNEKSLAVVVPPPTYPLALSRSAGGLENVSFSQPFFFVDYSEPVSWLRTSFFYLYSFSVLVSCQSFFPVVFTFFGSDSDILVICKYTKDVRQICLQTHFLAWRSDRAMLVKRCERDKTKGCDGGLYWKRDEETGICNGPSLETGIENEE